MEDIKNNVHGESIHLAEEKVFTQEELNLIIKKRLERLKIKLEKEYEQKLQEEKSLLIHEQMKFEVMKGLAERGIPSEFADFVITEDIEKTKQNLEVFQKEFQKLTESVINERLGKVIQMSLTQN